MSWIFLEPSDVWSFRDGRPFIAGEARAARSIYPPTPFTVQGALRSLILGHKNVDWEKFANQSDADAQALGQEIGYPAQKDGTPASLGDFRMRGPFRARLTDNDKAEILFPLPLDTYYSEDGYWRPLRPQKLPPGWASNWLASLSPLLPQPEPPRTKAPEDEEKLLELSAIESYLEGKPFQPLPGRDTGFEPRLGLAIDYTVRHAREQMLYHADFVRPGSADENHYSLDENRYGLAVELGPHVKLPDAPVMGLGGEMRAAHCRYLSQAPLPPSQSTGTQFKIALLTPAWFSDGWQPKVEDGRWQALFESPDAEIRCVAAAIGRPLYAGGWDVALRSHKPLRGFVPPGSVYYFTTNEPLVKMPESFTQTPPQTLSFADQGLGVYISGEWDWLTGS